MTSQLETELGDPQEILAMLSPDEATTVLRLLRQAKAEQQESLDAAIKAALDVLPRLVRIPARKILFGR